MLHLFLRSLLVFALVGVLLQRREEAALAARKHEQLRVGQLLVLPCPPPDEAGRALLMRAGEAGGLTARGWTRTLRLARTIADLDGRDGVLRRHIAEALVHRRSTVGAQGDFERSADGRAEATAWSRLP